VLRDRSGGGHFRGDLVVLKGGYYVSHRHSRLPLLHNPESIPDSDLAPLTEDECCILDAIPTYTRYAVYSTPRKLEWGVGLKVGDAVFARLPVRSGRGSCGEEYSTVIIRWIGMYDDDRHRFGVEIKVSE
jgi:hypothetical protein